MSYSFTARFLGAGLGELFTNAALEIRWRHDTEMQTASGTVFATRLELGSIQQQKESILKNTFKNHFDIPNLLAPTLQLAPTQIFRLSDIPEIHLLGR